LGFECLQIVQEITCTWFRPISSFMLFQLFIFTNRHLLLQRVLLLTLINLLLDTSKNISPLFHLSLLCRSVYWVLLLLVNSLQLIVQVIFRRSLCIEILKLLCHLLFLCFPQSIALCQQPSFSGLYRLWT